MFLHLVLVRTPQRKALAQQASEMETHHYIDCIRNLVLSVIYAGLQTQASFNKHDSNIKGFLTCDHQSPSAIGFPPIIFCKACIDSSIVPCNIINFQATIFPYEYSIKLKKTHNS